MLNNFKDDLPDSEDEDKKRSKFSQSIDLKIIKYQKTKDLQEVIEVESHEEKYNEKYSIKMVYSYS